MTYSPWYRTPKCSARRRGVAAERDRPDRSSSIDRHARLEGRVDAARAWSRSVTMIDRQDPAPRHHPRERHGARRRGHAPRPRRAGEGPCRDDLGRNGPAGAWNPRSSRNSASGRRQSRRPGRLRRTVRARRCRPSVRPVGRPRREAHSRTAMRAPTSRPAPLGGPALCLPASGRCFPATCIPATGRQDSSGREPVRRRWGGVAG